MDDGKHVDLGSLPALASFVTNSDAVFMIKRLDSAKSVATLFSLVSTSEWEIERLEIQPELPALPVKLGSAVQRSGTIRGLVLGKRTTECKSKPVLCGFAAAALGPRLERLEIYNLKIRPGLGKALAQCTSLTDLTIIGCNMSYISIGELTDGIAAAQSLESVHFARNNLMEYFAEGLINDALSKLPHLNQLVLIIGKMDDKACEALAAVPSLPKLRVLSLEENNMETVTALLSKLPMKCRWETLNLSSNYIDGRLEELIIRAPLLCSLDISGNSIGEAAAGVIGRTIGRAKVLRSLRLFYCRLKKAGTVALLKPMQGCPLESLSMNHNNAGDQGAKVVSDCLGSKCKILDMVLEEITQQGAKELAKALRRASEIVSLNLTSNLMIGPEGAVAVCDSLQSWRAMQELNLGDCRIGDAGAAAVARVMLRVGCRRVILSSNDINSSGVKALAEAAANSPVVIELLQLSRNPVGNEGAKSLAEKIIRPNRNVEELVICWVEMGDEGAKAIESAARARKAGGSLRKVEICVSGCGHEGQMAVSAVGWMFGES